MRKIFPALYFLIFACFVPAFAQEAAAPEASSPATSLSAELVKSAWEASSKNDIERLMQIVNQCVEKFDADARHQQSHLRSFPPRGEEYKYESLNDVATCLFIKAEALMNQGRRDEAIIQFQEIIDDYSWAQAWDPRGWFWSVSEKSQASIDVLTGKAQDDLDKEVLKTNRTKPKLFTPGKERVIDYTKYGKFENVGTENYTYQITDMRGLIEAAGEGVYPNETDVHKNPRYKEARKEGRLKGKHWDYNNSDDLEATYFKWVTAPEPPGVKLFYLGLTFEKAGMYFEAIKAYYALVVHFPKTTAWTYWQTPWYPGQAAIAKIKYLIRIHPELNLEEKWIKIKVLNGYDNDVSNDVFIVYPGKIIEKKMVKGKEVQRADVNVPMGRVKTSIGEGNVKLVQYDNGHWQLIVDDKPYIIKGMNYSPTKVGQSPDKGTLTNWMENDINNNGRIDGPYDSWVDKNFNNKQDPSEPAVGDFQLMKEMGVNTLRIYHQPHPLSKPLMTKMFNDFGIRVAMGDFLGKYAIGSGASWTEGTDYDNAEHKAKMMESVRKMVEEFKDEPYLLMWVLGNENNYGVANNADKKPESYYKFVDEVAQMIKSIDKNHPVAVVNGDALFLDIFAKNCPHVDIFAANIYRGNYGFGSFWEQVMDASGKAAMISEYGCPAYARHLTKEEGDNAQAEYHRGNWLDIQENLAGQEGIGNALGGIAFEWLDEWWKNYEPYLHDRKSDAIGPFPGGFYFEEWFGLVGQGNGSQSPFIRQLRKSYFIYKELWNQAF